jgi:RIO-like serine/threonine protein kinase
VSAIHEKAFTPEQYEALGAHIMTQINDMIANCKLPKEIDAQFHLVIAQIINGVEEMKVSASSDQGAEKIIQALVDYGKYFTHAGWQPL